MFELYLNSEGLLFQENQSNLNIRTREVIKILLQETNPTIRIGHVHSLFSTLSKALGIGEFRTPGAIQNIVTFLSKYERFLSYSFV